jgi:DNA mismatch endonuclease, patch repair protein
MADIFTPEKRSEVRSRIRGRDTRPERLVRSLLHRLGCRFTVTGPKNRLLPGRPDIVLPKFRTVVFVHGCFWHGHEHCPDFRLPQSRRDWWTKPKRTGKFAMRIREQAATVVTSPFLLLGQGRFLDATGNRPIAIGWKLKHPMPIADYREARLASGMED